MSTTLAIFSPNEIQYFLPQGKPDPKLPFLLQHTGPRVEQKPQKGMITCVYYALNALRTRYGKSCSPLVEKGRAFEILFSQRRKKITALDSTYYHLYQENKREVAITTPSLLRILASTMSCEGIVLQAKKDIPMALAQLRKQSLHDPDANDLASIIFTQGPKLLDAFIENKNSADLAGYIHSLQEEYVSALIQIEWEFLKEIKKNPHEEFEQYVLSLTTHEKKPLILPRQIGQLPLTLKANFLQSFSHLIAYEKLGLIPSSFHRLTKAKDCLLLLKEKGPMAVIGFFGKAYYGTSPTKFDTIKERDVWGWKKSDPFTTGDGSTHMVIVTGIKITEAGRAFIFYVDPAEGSNPQNASKQKIYIARYESFKARMRNIANLEGYMIDLPYALHKPAHDLPVNTE